MSPVDKGKKLSLREVKFPPRSPAGRVRSLLCALRAIRGLRAPLWEGGRL